MVREVNEKDFDLALKGAKVALVDFWAPWCGPCRMVAPHVEAVAEKLDDEAAFLKVNVDDNQTLAERYGVMSIPTLVIFKDGQEAARIVGAQGQEAIESAMREWI